MVRLGTDIYRKQKLAVKTRHRLLGDIFHVTRRQFPSSALQIQLEPVRFPTILSSTPLARFPPAFHYVGSDMLISPVTWFASTGFSLRESEMYRGPSDFTIPFPLELYNISHSQSHILVSRLFLKMESLYIFSP